MSEAQKFDWYTEAKTAFEKVARHGRSHHNKPGPTEQKFFEKTCEAIISGNFTDEDFQGIQRAVAMTGVCHDLQNTIKTIHETAKKVRNQP